MEKDNFEAELSQAYNDKLSWYISNVIPEILQNYVALHSLVDNILSTLISKGVIIADPYRKDKRITSIQPIDKSQYLDSERSKQIGVRLSDYELILDYICTYFNFSVDTLTTENIKKLLDFNETFLWHNVVKTSKARNTRGLAECLQPIRGGSDTFAIDLINNNLASAGKLNESINASLKDFASFQREIYKMTIRKEVMSDESFTEEDYASPEALDDKIRKVFKQKGMKISFYPELIKEIVSETVGPDKEKFRAALMQKFNVEDPKKKQKKEVKVDAHAILIEALRTMTATAPQLGKTSQKIEENTDIMEGARMTNWQKFILALRRAFNLKDKPLKYKVIITDPLTQAKRNEVVDVTEFIRNMEHRAKVYNAISNPDSQAFAKISEKSDQAILDYIIKNCSECQKLLLTISALDEYFKTQTPKSKRSKIKGLAMEITAIKNTLIKTNQKKADYVNIIEEQVQMQRLGVLDEPSV
ncbi:MAG: hypothetical protein K5839_01135 [Treponemataceae bacterium]|nr:hypothetical protein [Treponemataceae bacterium]